MASLSPSTGDPATAGAAGAAATAAPVAAAGAATGAAPAAAAPAAEATTAAAAASATTEDGGGAVMVTGTAEPAYDAATDDLALSLAAIAGRLDTVTLRGGSLALAPSPAAAPAAPLVAEGCKRLTQLVHNNPLNKREALGRGALPLLAAVLGATEFVPDPDTAPAAVAADSAGAGAASTAAAAAAAPTPTDSSAATGGAGSSEAAADAAPGPARSPLVDLPPGIELHVRTLAAKAVRSMCFKHPEAKDAVHAAHVLAGIVATLSLAARTLEGHDRAGHSPALIAHAMVAAEEALYTTVALLNNHELNTAVVRDAGVGKLVARVASAVTKVPLPPGVGAGVPSPADVCNRAQFVQLMLTPD